MAPDGVIVWACHMAAIEPSTKYALAFVDGQNLYRHAKDAFGHHHPNYDPINSMRPYAPNMDGRPIWFDFTRASLTLKSLLCGHLTGPIAS